MNVKLTKKQMLCAGATGLWFLATKSSVLSHTSGERTSPGRNRSEASMESVPEDLDSVQDASTFPWIDENFPLDPAVLRDFSPVPSTSTSSGQSTGPPYSFTLSSSNALEQLKNIMAYYNERAVYEGSLLSFAGDRCIFYHFLSLIWFFYRIEICLKSLEKQEIGPKKILYTADCTRNFVFRPIPFVHYFLPEAINCEVQTVCQVESGQIVHHKDVYTKLGLSWNLEVPSLWSVTKYTAGMAYTYLLNMFYFAYHLLHVVISMLGFEK